MSKTESEEILNYIKIYNAPRRNKLEMILSVLYVCQQPIILTRLMYKTNINCVVLKNITIALVSRGLIVTKKKTKKRSYYNITTKGMNFLQKAREMKAIWEVDADNKVN